MSARDGLVAFVVYKAIVFGLAFVALVAVAHVTPTSLGHFVELLSPSSSSPSGSSWTAAAFMAAQACSLAAFFFFYRLARTELSRPAALVALTAFALFPTAYLLSAPSADALSCAASFAMIAFLRDERYGAAAATAAIACVSRASGALLLPALASQAWVARHRLSRRQARGFALVAAASVAGTGLGLGLIAGHPRALGAPLAWPTSSELGFIAAALIGLVAMALKPRPWRPEKTFDFIYVSVGLSVLVFTSLGSSRPRALLLLYPLFFELAPWLEKSIPRLGLYLLGSSALFGVCWALYLSGQF